MAKANKLADIFVPSELLSVLGADDGDVIPESGFNKPANPVTYTLNMQTADGDLDPYFEEAEIADLPLSMRITEDSVVTLKLSGDWNWVFDDPPLKLAKNGTKPTATPPRMRYCHPRKTSDTLTFYAKYYKAGPKYNADRFNIWLKFEKAGVTCFLKIDPDIKNPGDKVLVPPPGRSRMKRKHR
jgi:hypothetical protein